MALVDFTAIDLAAPYAIMTAELLGDRDSYPCPDCEQPMGWGMPFSMVMTQQPVYDEDDELIVPPVMTAFCVYCAPTA